LIGETSATFKLADGTVIAGLFSEDLGDLETGQPVRLDVVDGNIELFDPESQRSLRQK
jgi:hypothetical protein